MYEPIAGESGKQPHLNGQNGRNHEPAKPPEQRRHRARPHSAAPSIKVERCPDERLENGFAKRDNNPGKHSPIPSSTLDRSYANL